MDAPSGEAQRGAAVGSSARPQSGDEPVLGIAAAQPLRERAPETTEPRGTPSEPRLDEVAFHREPRLDEVAFSPHYGVPPIPETVLSPAPTLLTDCNPKPRESEFSAGVRFAKLRKREVSERQQEVARATAAVAASERSSSSSASATRSSTYFSPTARPNTARRWRAGRSLQVELPPRRVHFLAAMEPPVLARDGVEGALLEASWGP